nr:helix-turn-helix domain-containing protein [Ktedonobacteraceae bacterium]
MNTHEQKRVMVLNQVRSGQLSAAQAASLLNLSLRQVQRKLAAYEKEGPAALAHGNRHRKPIHTINEQVRKPVISLATTTYRGCNQQHLRDLLEEREGLKLSRASVHRILQQAGVLAPSTQRPPQHRRRRPRYPQSGQLVQIDGSKHLWLQERGGSLTLLAAIDDATSRVEAAVFREQEDAAGSMELLKQLLQRH